MARATRFLILVLRYWFAITYLVGGLALVAWAVVEVASSPNWFIAVYQAAFAGPFLAILGWLILPSRGKRWLSGSMRTLPGVRGAKV